MKNRKDTFTSDKNEKLLKMKELSEITEVSSGTIRYYIQQGLLPQPHKPHKNMAYYDESYVEKVRLIKDLQQNHFLPLEVIKMVINENGYDLKKAKNWLNQADHISWFESKLEQNDLKPMSKDEILEFSGVDIEDFDAAIKYNMVKPDKNGLFNKEDIEVALLASEFRKIGLTVERGFTIEFLVLHYEMLEFLARKEVDIFAKNILNNDLSFDDIYEVAEKAMDIIYKLAPIIHRRFLRKLLDDIRKDTK